MKNKLLLLALLLYSLTIYSQAISDKAIILFIGNQGVFNEKITEGENVDFLNSIEADGFEGDAMYIGFAGYLKLWEIFELNTNFYLQSDLAPVNYKLSATYLYNNYLGVGLSFIGYQQYINDFYRFYWNNSEGIFPDLNPNYRQQRIYNMGMGIGPEIKLENSLINFTLKLHGGIRWIKKFENNLWQKEINGNYTNFFKHEATNSPSPVLLPELALEIIPIKLLKTSIGFRMALNGEFSNRRINYTRTFAEWTIDEQISKFIGSPSHSYTKIDIDFGLIVKW